MSYLITNLTSKTPGEDFLTSIHATPSHSSVAVSAVSQNLRRSLSNARRIVVKAGTGIVTEPNGVPSLSRIGAIVEQICWLRKSGKEVILVSSGAVGIGRQLIRRQMMMKSFEEKTPLTTEDIEGVKSKWYNSTAAGAGQLGLLSLYETLFHQWDVAISQILLTEFDFRSQDRYHYINATLTKLLKVGVVPILNENDAVSGNTGYYVRDGAFSDNDGLASLVAAQMKADLLILLTDVEGLYTLPPHDPNARIISHYTNNLQFSLGDKSEQGRGGMAAKIQAAMTAVEKGVGAVVIASGKQPRTMQQILHGDDVGTLFMNAPLSPSQPPVQKKDTKVKDALRDMATRARDAGRLLQSLTAEERDAILYRIADALLANSDRILAANKEDMESAQKNKVADELVKRLKVTPQKLETLAKGIRAIAASGDPIGKVTARTEVASGLVLSKTTVPIGCILVIFESRPDSLPQICSLCIRTGNGLLLKGGKEAAASNSVLYQIVGGAIEEATKGKVPRDVIGLVSGRTDVAELLTMSDVIDLVIPRGSGTMVSNIKRSTQIPVMGHAEGICHVFVDQHADIKKAIAICDDGKTDYPAACNSMETLLLHERLCLPANPNREPVAVQLLAELRQAGVKLLSGPAAEDKLSLYFPFDGRVESFRTEYGEKTLSVEVVPDLPSAVEHIHRYGSSHTEVIVTENRETARAFLRLVDAACVFWNASPRFADGYRFGLGAEVGISTGRVHARGPVGAEGLLTVKWMLESASAHVVDGDRGVVYTHKALPTAAKL